MDLYAKRERKPRGRRVAAGIAATVAGAAVLLALVRAGGPPEVEITTSVPGIGPATEIVIDVAKGGRGLGSVRAVLVQGVNEHLLGEATHRPRPFWAFWGPRATHERLVATVGREAVPELVEGTAIVRVVAERAPTWLRHPDPVVVDLPLPVRFVPPELTVLSDQVYVAQGGSEAVVYRVGERSARDGVEVAGHWFPGAPLPGGGAGEHFVFFGVPYDVGEREAIRLVAEDELGNRIEMPFVDRFVAHPPRQSTIRLSDSFLEKVVSEITARTPDLRRSESLLETYLSINRDLRQRNRAKLVELGSLSADEILWRGAFRQQPSTQVMDRFAASRTYSYEGREVDRQVHLGYDLASVRRAPVLAANRGRVVWADYLGIYGNAVVLDHGYGLESLYAHLSEIAVEVGALVEKGERLGRTGATGLAGGDHLHFTTIVRGVMVDPAEWFDAHWIEDRIARKLPGLITME